MNIVIVCALIFLLGAICGWCFFNFICKYRFVSKYKAGEFIIDPMSNTNNAPNTYLRTTEHLEKVINRPFAVYIVRWLGRSKEYTKDIYTNKGE